MRSLVSQTSFFRNSHVSNTLGSAMHRKAFHHPKVYAIVLNYNGRDTLKRCLQSLYSTDYPQLEIVVVDNNSTDGSIEKVKNQFSRCHYLLLRKNVGFAAGNNHAIRWALEKGAKYVFLLNNDAYVNRDTIGRLVETAEKRKSPTLLSPLILKAPNEKEYWFCGGKILWGRMRSVHVSCKREQKKPYVTTYLTGCALFIPQQVCEKVGLLDERYFLYYEDVDYCLRAHRFGYRSMIVPHARAFHYENSESNPHKLYWLVLSGVIFFQKNTPKHHRFQMSLYLFARKCKNKVQLLLGKNREHAEILKNAFQDAKKAETLHNNRPL